MRVPWQRRQGPLFRLGRYGFRNWRTLSLSDHISLGSYASHKHILGLTGTGKSVLLANLFTQMVEQGIAASLIDPHSDLADDTLSILSRRGLLENVYHVDFGRTDAYLPFNILQQPYARDPQHIAKNIVDAFQRSWPALAGGAAPHFENLLLSGANRPRHDPGGGGRRPRGARPRPGVPVVDAKMVVRRGRSRPDDVPLVSPTLPGSQGSFASRRP